MPSERDLSHLILAAYEAAAEPQKWPAFLKMFAESAKGANAAILLNDYQRRQYDISSSYNVDPEAGRLYQSHYVEKDAYYVGGKDELCTGWCGTSQMLISDDQLLRSEFYQDYQRHFEMFHLCAAIMRFDSNAVSCLTLLRSRPKGAFDAEQVRLLELLLPHLQMAFGLHRRLVELRAINRNFEQALALTPVAIVLVDSIGKILSATERAQQILRLGDGLCTRAGILQIDHSDHAAGLRLAIRVAASPGLTAEPILRSLLVQRTPPKSPLTVCVYPLRSYALAPGLGESTVAVFILDPDEEPPKIDAVLQAVFRLTPAEIRLASLLGRGIALNEAAEIIGVTRNTVKSQISSIFAKTGASTQNRLVHLLATLQAQLPFRSKI